MCAHILKINKEFFFLRVRMIDREFLFSSPEGLISFDPLQLHVFYVEIKVVTRLINSYCQIQNSCYNDQEFKRPVRIYRSKYYTVIVTNKGI